jgi:hypothetical protein
MTKRLLCIIENPHEVKSLVPICELAEQKSHGQLSFHYVAQDAYLFQGVEEALRQRGVQNSSQLPICRSLRRPLPFHFLAVRWWVQYRSRFMVADLARNYDGLICGVDSSLICILIDEMKRKGKPTCLVVGGIDYPHPKGKIPWNQRVKNILRNAASRILPHAEYMRSVGLFNEHTSGCDHVFVAGEGTAEALIARGVSRSTVKATGLPCFASLFPIAPPRFPAASETFTILYIGGAFAWHGMHSAQRRQSAQLQEFVQAFSQLPQRFRLLLRPHPREDRKAYDWLVGCDRIDISDLGRPLHDDLRSASLTLGMISNVLLESLAFGVPSASLTFPEDEGTWSTYKLSCPGGTIVELDSASAVLDFIREISLDERKYIDLVRSEVPVLQYNVADSTPNAVNLIAEEIVESVLGKETFPSGVTIEMHVPC